MCLTVTPRRWLPAPKLTLLGGVCAIVIACSADQGDPLPIAAELAAGLATGDVRTVPFAGTSGADAQADLDRLVAGMAPASASVTVGESVATSRMAPSDQTTTSTATVGFTVTWDLDGPGPGEQTWQYETAVDLTQRSGDDPPAWRAVWDPSVVHPDLDAGSRLALAREQPPRADITGADGEVLVAQRSVARIGIDKVRLGDADPAAAARDLAAAVGVDPQRVVDAVAAAGPEAFVEAIVLRASAADGVRDAVEAVPGGRLIPDQLPLAPTREFARALLGTVGEATAEIVDAAGGAVLPGDLVGLSGLQAAYDPQLRGTPGYTVTLVESGVGQPDEPGEAGQPDKEDRVLLTLPPSPGDPLRTTLSARTQQLADDLLADVGPPSALVAMRPSTGELLAVASGPGSEGFSTATLGRYSPGSVFKVATTLALLRNGLSSEAVLPCSETITIDGKAFTNYAGYPSAALGSIPLRRAFAESCNTAFVAQVDTLDPAGLAAAAADLGIGGTPLGFPAFTGSLGEPGSRVDLAASLIGQGTVLVSPIAAATMAAAAVGGASTPVLLPAAGPAPSAPAITPDEAATLRSLMQQAVRDGTGRVLAGIAGEPVAAKSGTAQFGDDVPPATHGWMIAVQGDLAVAVFVEEADSGAATAGPIAAEFLRGLPSS